jgi:alpha-D-xyloside xylohydrolase
MEGGRWLTETYDFMSLPLWVRPNTALPVGCCDEKPDYDYTKGLAVKLYGIEDGSEIRLPIPSLNGDTAMTVHVRRAGDAISVEAEKPVKALIVSGDGKIKA